jgi:putative transposase
MLNVLNVSRSGYYAWLVRPKSKRALENEALEKDIEEVYNESRELSGSLKVQKGLEARGIKVSRPRVARIMKSRGWRGKCKRKFRVTTDSKHSLGYFENKLNRAFGAERPNMKWASDITYIPTSEGWLYLAVVLDLFSRRTVGWAMGTSLEASLPVSALEMARVTRKPSDGLLHHSDRGVQYASLEFQAAVSKFNGVSSMSRKRPKPEGAAVRVKKGNCWDNAVVESFFSTLKLELGLDKVIGSREVTKAVVFEWIEVFYNRKRLHSTIGYKSPAAFEESWYKAQVPNFMSTTS